MEAGKRCSKMSRSSSSSSDASRRKGHFKEPEMSSKLEHYRAKCSDVEADRDHRMSCDQLAGKVEKKRKGRKIKRRRSKSEESSSFTSSESENCPKKRKRKEKKRKEKKKKKKHKRGKERRINNLNSENQDSLREGTSKEEVQEEMNIEPGPSVKPADSTEEPKRRTMAPMTKEEYDKQQSKVRRVFDHETGRERLIKGEGEIIEDIVSYERHQAINKLATVGDGATFQKSLGLNRYDHDSKIYRS